MKQPSVKKNLIYNFIFQTIAAVLPLITGPYVARILEADGVGTFSYIQSYMTLFTLTAALGTPTYGMREIARSRNNKIEYSRKFWEIELLTVLTSTVCLLVWLILVAFSSNYKFYLIAFIPSLFATMLDISWFFTAHEKIGYIVFWNALCKIIGAVCVFLFINDKGDLFEYILINTVVYVFANLSMWIFLPKMLVKIDPKTFALKKHFQESIIYFIPSIAISVYTVLDKTLIGVITHDEFQNGYYEQATKIMSLGKAAVFGTVNPVMAPRISYLFSENKIDEIKTRIEKTMDFILLLGFAVTFGIIAVAKDFVPVFFGVGYEPVTGLLYLISPLILIIGISNCLETQYYSPAGLRAQSTKYIIEGSVINLIMNIILIPMFGAMGAVVGSIVAELAITFLNLKNCSGYLSMKQVLLCSYKRLFSGIIMFIAVKAVSNCGFTGVLLLLLEVIVGAVVYFACLYVFRDKMLKSLLNDLLFRKIQSK